MSSWKPGLCPVCKAEARLLYDAAKQHSDVECSSCEKFDISDQLYQFIWEDRFDAEFRQKLSKALKFASDQSVNTHLVNPSDISRCLGELEKSDQQKRQRTP